MKLIKLTLAEAQEPVLVNPEKIVSICKLPGRSSKQSSFNLPEVTTVELTTGTRVRVSQTIDEVETLINQ